LFNAGYQLGQQPTFIEVDLDEGTAAGTHSPGRNDRLSVVGRAVRAWLDVDRRTVGDAGQKLR
jgi:hypothetical protein